MAFFDEMILPSGVSGPVDLLAISLSLRFLLRDMGGSSQNSGVWSQELKPLRFEHTGWVQGFWAAWAVSGRGRCCVLWELGRRDSWKIVVKASKRLRLWDAID